MKRFARFIVVSILAALVRQLRKRNDFKIVAVVGSIGKTSTKLAIAQLLGAKYRVQFQDGNYNDLVTVPLVFYGLDEPALFNPFAWLGTFWKMWRANHETYPFDVVVLELGTDGPGQIEKFSRFLQIDIAVVTAISYEHMEFFADLDAVADEELAVDGFSSQLLVNYDLCSEVFLSRLVTPMTTYGYSESADVFISETFFSRTGAEFRLHLRPELIIESTHPSVARSQLYSICAAAWVGAQLDMTKVEITTGIQSIKPVAGRLNILSGIQQTTLIDDTYNSSPEAAKAALETLYYLDAPQKIVLLGNMNELGDYSAELHRQVGELCDPRQLAHVFTLGPDANQHLATAAEAQGCQVYRCQTPYQAAEMIQQRLVKGALVLLKGSQNGVYAEEATKQLLADPGDAAKLVRQSTQWLKKKQKSFEAIAGS